MHGVHDWDGSYRTETASKVLPQPRRRSRYRGVFDTGKKWKAQIHCGGKQLYLGLFADEEDAAKAYDEAAIRFHGSHAVCNFPDAHLHAAMPRRANIHPVSSVACEFAATQPYGVQPLCFSCGQRHCIQNLQKYMSQVEGYRRSLQIRASFALEGLTQQHSESPPSSLADEYITLIIREHHCREQLEHVANLMKDRAATPSPPVYMAVQFRKRRGGFVARWPAKSPKV